MLEGKPVETSEVETMDAIKHILSDFQDEIDEIHFAREKRVGPEPQVTEEPQSLQPICNVDAKVTRAKFSSIPSVEASLTQILPMAAAMEARPSRLDRDAVAPDAAEPAQKTQQKPAMNPLEVFTIRRVAFALLGLNMVLMPLAFLWLALLTLVAIGTVFLLFGSDAVWNGVSKMLRWYCARHPERADALYDKLDDIAVVWDNFLDRFPDGTVDRLYLPDFANLEEIERQHETKVAERLERMHSQA